MLRNSLLILFISISVHFQTLHLAHDDTDTLQCLNCHFSHESNIKSAYYIASQNNF